LSHDSVCLFTK